VKFLIHLELLIEKCRQWAGGMAQAIEHLRCEHKALSSNPSPTKNKRKKNVGKVAIYHRAHQVGV
jgi:hypothetical protein